MRAFLKQLLLFITPILVLGALLEWAVRSYPTIMHQKAEGIAQHADSIEVLVLGTSHADCGVDPREFSLWTFNSAMGSQSLYFDIALTRKHLDRLTSLKYVLISVDYHSLQFLNADENDFMYDAHYDLQFEGNVDFKWRLSQLIWGYGVREGVTLLFRPQIGCERGYFPTDDVIRNGLTDDAGKKRAVFFDRYMEGDAVYRDTILTMLTDFVVELKGRDITPVFVTLPCHHVFNRYLDPRMEQRNRDDIAKLCSQFDLEHLDWQRMPLPDSMFANQDHLRASGAAEVSRRLNAYLESRDFNRPAFAAQAFEGTMSSE